MANYNLDVTNQFAVEKLAALDPKIMAENSNTVYDKETATFKVPHLGKIYQVSYPGGEVTIDNENSEISLHTKILILHYLTFSKGVPLTKQEITYKELPNGSIYIDPFTKRTIKPMLDNFGQRTGEFLELAKRLGGEESTYGDISVTIKVFPNVPITYVIWEGDDEFPASGNILFDGSASYYLPTEDYAFVTSMVIWALKGMADKKAEKG
jgi:hypothetical protein